jgi:hypothetical protein
MKLVTLFATLLAAATVVVSKPVGAAGKLDGVAKLDCVPTTVWGCGSFGDCERGTALSENLPQIFTIDLNRKTLGGGEKGEQSIIDRITRNGDKTVLSGTDGGRAWVVTINLTTGDLRAGVVGEGESFMIYGLCLAQ